MIEFTKKSGKGRTSSCMGEEVSVTFGKSHGHGKQQLRFSFSTKACKMAFGNEIYGVAGTDKNNPERIYFAPSDKKNGFMLTKGSAESENARRYSTFGNAGVKIYGEDVDFVGDYSLEYDAKTGLLFIDKNHKK